jgi:glycosyltransferase involved in cell wall biosynthesis
MPVFNAGRLVLRAIQSILTQDLAAFELVLLDDGSTDDSAAIAAGFAAQDARIRFVRHDQNRGLTTTLNEGLHLAAAPLVARMDSDDESLPNRLAVQTSFMNAHPEVAVAGSYVYHMGVRPRYDHLIELPTGAEEVREVLKVSNCLYHPSVIFRREVVEGEGGYRADFPDGEDYELWLRLSRTHAVCNIAQPLLRYRFATDGMTFRRRWRQLYYVYLAQATHLAEPVSFPAARARADQMMLETDRRYFFGEVAKGTIAEFLRLRLWRHAARLIVSLEDELDPAITAELARQVVHAAVIPSTDERL